MAPPAGEKTTGILLIAHGGDPSWNAAVEEMLRGARLAGPAEPVFGMANGPGMQAAIERLEKAGARRIVAIPLFVSSHSSLFRQVAWQLGLRSEPDAGFLHAMDLLAARMRREHGPHHGRRMDAVHVRVRSKLPIRLTRALDDDPLAAGILADRARALSRAPEKEALVLVAHGPLAEDDNRRWLEDMHGLVGRIRRELPFRTVRIHTLRDDAPPAVRDKAVRDLRASVEALSKKGTVLVVPHLIARGGIEHKLRRDLDGLDYAWSGETLAPHPNLSRWIERRALAASPAAASR